MAFARESDAVFASYHPLINFAGCRRSIRSTLGGWRSMDSVTKSLTGQATRCLACSAGTLIGEGLSVSAIAPLACPSGTHHGAGLAVNFLLIESLQRFYQYYGDDLQV